MSKTLHVTVGLPGSGKTSWAQEKCYASRGGGGWRSYSSPTVSHIDVDTYLKNSYYKAHYKDEFEYISRNMSSGYNEYIIDTFIASNDSLINLLKKVVVSGITHVDIHYWEPNVEACIWNDRGRREEDSTITIKNAKIEVPDIERIQKELDLTGKKVKVSLTKHKTEKKADWKVFYEEVCKKHGHMDERGWINGESWCMGGTWGNCWGDSGTVSGEAPPETFSALDGILEEVCPDISFLKYKKIWSQIVDTDEYGESDYYGGSTSHANYRFKVEGLYETLKEMGLYEIKK